MKKVFLNVFILAIIFSSCEKHEIINTDSKLKDRSMLFAEANALSLKHDSIVLELLAQSDIHAKFKINGLTGPQSGASEFILSDVFDVIEAVTGVKPVYAEKDDMKGSMQKIIEQQLPVFDFDQQSISLSNYTNSAQLDTYLSSVDEILQNEGIDVNEKIKLINDIQHNASKNQQLTDEEYSKFLNTTEVLKGSLILWSDNIVDNVSIKESVLMKAKSPTQWSFVAKLAFVAAADAVGAIAGTYIGGYIIVNGVPIYIPAGPQGTVAGLATLSFLASKMVGW